MKRHHGAQNECPKTCPAINTVSYLLGTPRFSWFCVKRSRDFILGTHSFLFWHTLSFLGAHSLRAPDGARADAPFRPPFWAHHAVSWPAGRCLLAAGFLVLAVHALPRLWRDGAWKCWRRQVPRTDTQTGPARGAAGKLETTKIKNRDFFWAHAFLFDVTNPMRKLVCQLYWRS